MVVVVLVGGGARGWWMVVVGGGWWVGERCGGWCACVLDRWVGGGVLWL